MKKFLLLKGCAGLGNRFITLQKAILYAQKNNRILYVDWSDGMFAPEGENAFYKYFTLSNVKSIDSIEPIVDSISNGASIYPKSLTLEEVCGSIYKNFWHVGSWLSWHFPIYRVAATTIFKGKIASVFGLQSWQRKYDVDYSWQKNIKYVFSEENIQLGAQLKDHINRDVVVFVDFRPLVDIKNIFNYVHLKDQYYNKFMNFALEHDLINKGIGVHIRATDKKPQKEIDKLATLIGKLISEESDLKIFLSTDSISVTNDFMHRYRDNIVTYPKFLPDNLEGKGIHHWALNNQDKEVTSQMFEDSLADMWILSMCKYLLWQGNSSFSLMSKLLKNDKKRTINWMNH